MKIVIIALEDENHTAPLKWALEQAGYPVVCWGGLSWMEDQQATLRFDSSGTQIRLGQYIVDPGDVVWIRRPNLPVHNPAVSEADRTFAEKEYQWHFSSLMYLLERLPVRCINPYSASRVINNKAVQLHLATWCGLSVPETLMTNSPADIRAFLSHSSRRAVCKSFFPHIWRKEDGAGLAVTETFALSAEDLPQDEVLTYAPAIYQNRVAKVFDVRMVLLGTTVYSFSLHTQKGALDWRQEIGRDGISVEEISTPADVETAVLAFAEKAGITFGSFDFAIDENGTWWFLEVNEEGQFLWLDDLNPQIRILEKFLAFLTLPATASRAAIEAQQSVFPSLKEYARSPKQHRVPAQANFAATVSSIEP
jgi:glutathione synthase/RimK-type ligase-like ATP-grasp enzyme